MFLVRIAIGCLFLFSGGEKLLSPYQNFLYVIQSYQMLPSWAEVTVARVFPWLEFFIGLFVVLGLWTVQALKASLTMLAVFIITVSQALGRGLPIDQCGCFGEAIHIPLKGVLLFDSFMVLLIAWIIRFPSRLQRFSLDARLK